MSDVNVFIEPLAPPPSPVELPLLSHEDVMETLNAVAALKGKYQL